MSGLSAGPDLAKCDLHRRRPRGECAAYGVPFVVAGDVAGSRRERVREAVPAHVQVVENAGPVEQHVGEPATARDAISLVASSKMPLAGSPCMTWYWASAVDVTSSSTFVGSASSGVAAAAASAQVAEPCQEVLEYAEVVSFLIQTDGRQRSKPRAPPRNCVTHLEPLPWKMLNRSAAGFRGCLGLPAVWHRVICTHDHCDPRRFGQERRHCVRVLLRCPEGHIAPRVAGHACRCVVELRPADGALQAVREPDPGPRSPLRPSR